MLWGHNLWLKDHKYYKYPKKCQFRRTHALVTSKHRDLDLWVISHLFCLDFSPQPYHPSSRPPATQAQVQQRVSENLTQCLSDELQRMGQALEGLGARVVRGRASTLLGSVFRFG